MFITKHLRIGIIRTVTVAYESHRLLADLQNGLLKKNTAFLSICILLILPSVIINNKDLLKHGWVLTYIHKYLVTILDLFLIAEHPSSLKRLHLYWTMGFNAMIVGLLCQKHTVLNSKLTYRRTARNSLLRYLSFVNYIQ